jgi:hypothetical protein
VRNIAALAAATLGLLLAQPGTADAQEKARPVSGTVTDVNRAARTLVLGGETYFVPGKVHDFSQLEAGTSVILYWEWQGRRMVVKRIEPGSEG